MLNKTLSVDLQYLKLVNCMELKLLYKIVIFEIVKSVETNE